MNGAGKRNIWQVSTFADGQLGVVSRRSRKWRKVGLRVRLLPPLLAQLDRASGFEPEGRGFESLGAGHANAPWRQAEVEELSKLNYASRMPYRPGDGLVRQIRYR